MFPDFYQKIQDYCDEHSSPVSDQLKALERETYLKTLAPQMLTGAVQAVFLQMLIRIGKVHSILEVGTFTGYGTLAMAEALPEQGQIDTLEIDREYEYFHNKYFVSPYKEKIQVHWGNALNTLPELNKLYDLIYIDAGKQHYAFYLEQAIRLTKSGSLILADNVLWSGKVLNAEKDEDTQALHDFNQQISGLDVVGQHLIIPIRDGLHLMIRQ